jgi:hypothetical protein
LEPRYLIDRNWPYNEAQQRRADRWGAHHSGYVGSLVDKRMCEDKVKQRDLTREHYRLLLRWKERWPPLVDTLGVAATLFLASSIFLFVNEL